MVVILLGLSVSAPVWFFVAELATMPLGILWFAGGASIALAVASPLGWAGPVVFYGSVVASALLNAVLLREAAQAIRRCDLGPMRARRRQAACQSSASRP